MNTIRITIGRNDDNTLKVPEEFGKVSGYHGEISMDENGNLVFTDFSSNGTIINGQRVHKTSYQIYRGDEILLAGVCSVKWETLNNLLPPPQQPDGRATVLMEQDQQSGGRKTVLRDFGNNDNGGGRLTQLKDYDNGGRKTQLKGYDNNGMQNDSQNEPRPCLYGPPPTVHQEQPTILPSPAIHTGRIDSAAAVSKALKKWNWGAFFLSFIWGCFHRIYWPLIVPAANLVVFLLPFLMDRDLQIFGIIITWIVHLAVFVVAVYLGINGSERAWQLKVYENLEDFNAKEKRWATAGFIFFGFQIVAIAASVIAYLLTEGF
jgi:hypothetical protein